MVGSRAAIPQGDFPCNGENILKAAEGSPPAAKLANMHPLIARVKNSAMTFPQVHAPGLAGALVRSLTSGGSKSGPGSEAFHTNAVYRSPAFSIGQAGERYAPEYPTNGRTNGIAAAQAAAARPVPVIQLNRNIVDEEN